MTSSVDTSPPPSSLLCRGSHRTDGRGLSVLTACFSCKNANTAATAATAVQLDNGDRFSSVVFFYHPGFACSPPSSGLVRFLMMTGGHPIIDFLPFFLPSLRQSYKYLRVCLLLPF